MSENGAESGITKVLGHPLSTVIGALLTWLPANWSGAFGPTIVAAIAVVGAIGGLVGSLMYRRYISVLGNGAKPSGSLQRQAYDNLRTELIGGGSVTRVYSQTVRAFLGKVGRFLGDADRVDRMPFRHAFGVQTPGPMWTVPAFDRCLLLALVYPGAGIFFLWVVLGDAGPAGSLLHLDAGVLGWQRGLLAGSVVLAGFAFWRGSHSIEWTHIGWLMLAASSLVIGGVIIFGAAAIVIIGILSIALVIAGLRALTVAIVILPRDPSKAGFEFISELIQSQIGSFANEFTGLGTFVGALSVTFIYAILGGGFLILSLSLLVWVLSAYAFLRTHRLASESKQEGLFLLFVSITSILICVGAPAVLSSFGFWRDPIPALLFFELLALLKAPFDWISVGLMRALLMRGLERAGWWPLILSLLNAALTVVIIAILAASTVAGMQIFDLVTVWGGGKPVILLGSVLNEIANSHTPSAPTYWSIYALLLATAIPSALNLSIGGFASLSGIPGVAPLLLKYLPEGKAVPDFDRSWIAIVLTSQWFVGVALGLLVQVFLFWSIVFYVMPWMGPGLLDMSRAIADFRLPVQF